MIISIAIGGGSTLFRTSGNIFRSASDYVTSGWQREPTLRTNSSSSLPNQLAQLLVPATLVMRAHPKIRKFRSISEIVHQACTRRADNDYLDSPLQFYFTCLP